MTGVRIDHFIGIGMLGFVKVVDDLGGVNVCVPFNVNDPVSGLNLKAGEQHITGVQALAFWRTREDLGDGSDLQRIQRDQFMSVQVVKGVLHSGLLSNPIRLLRIVSDAAASMTTDAGMTVSDLVSIGQSFRDMTVPKVSTTPGPSSTGGAQVLTTSPANVKVEVLNGSGVSRVANEAAAGLTGRGFNVTGTGDAPNFAYTKSVIEYSTAADMPAVNTLEKELTNVTSLQVASVAPGTVDLILGSDFTGLKAQTSQNPQPTVSPTASASQASASASPSASASSSGVAGLAQANGGITGAAACSADSSAFAGPLSP